MLKILHVTFDMAIGGTEQVIRQLVLNLPTAEVHNEIFCIDGRIGAIGEGLQQQGVVVHQASRRAGLDRDLIASLRQQIRRGNYDIVHCHQYTPWVYGWFASIGTKARVILTEHGRFYPDRYRFKAWPLNLLMALTSFRLVAISKATKAALQQYELAPAFCTDVIYNAIQPLTVDLNRRALLQQELGLTAEHQVVGTVARLDPVKNQQMMLKAFAKVRSVMPNTVLLLVGDGPSRAELEQLVDALGIRDAVRFTGFQTQVAEYIALMDVYLLSSRTEGTSMTLLEAMNLAKPCVATAVGGNPEIVLHGETGLLSADDDADGFSEHMLQLLTQAAQRQRYGEAGRARFQALFSIDSMVKRYLTLYKKV